MSWTGLTCPAILIALPNTLKENIMSIKHLLTGKLGFGTAPLGNMFRNIPEEEALAALVKDANGNVLNDGDTVTVIKDLKIKGSSNVIKQGTKVKGIRLVDPEDGHDIDCKIPGIGQMNLKSEFVKKID